MEVNGRTAEPVRLFSDTYGIFTALEIMKNIFATLKVLVNDTS